MKKLYRSLFVFLLAAAMLLPLMGTIPAHASENDPAPAFPTFSIPSMVYGTLEEAGIPIDEIRAYFGEALAFEFVDGQLRIPTYGAEDFLYRDANDEERDYQQVGGYYYIDVTEEEHNQGFRCDLYGPDEVWEVNCYDAADYFFIEINTEQYGMSQYMTIYPYDGYGDYISIYFDNPQNTCGEVYYSDGMLESCISIYEYTEDAEFHAEYYADGSIARIYALVDHDWYYYLPDTGWTDTCEVIDSLDLETILAMVPSMYHCQHQWQDASCAIPEVCANCRAMKGEVLGHAWSEADPQAPCARCGSRRSPLLSLPNLSFGTPRPVANVSQLGIPFEAIRNALPTDLAFHYEDGMLTLPLLENAYVYVMYQDYYYDANTMFDGCYLPLEVDDLDALEIYYEFESDGHYLSLVYGFDGQPLCYTLEFYDEDGEYLGYCKETFSYHMITLYYYGDVANSDGYCIYNDTYLNGAFCEREVTYNFNDELDTEVEVRYDANGKLLYLEVEEETDVYYNFQYGDWSHGRNYYNPAPAPVIANTLSVEEMLALCPSGLDFLEAPNPDTDQPTNPPADTPNDDSHICPNPCEDSSGNGLLIAMVLGALVAIAIAAVAGYRMGKKTKA